MTSAAFPLPPDDDPEMADAIREAESVVAALAESYLDCIADDIARARQALEAATANPGDNADDIRVIFDVMHNIKGQGGSFGYDLLTTIGASLCDYIRNVANGTDARQTRVVAAHFAALDFVIDKNVKGDGGEAGAKLVAKLEELTAAVPPPA